MKKKIIIIAVILLLTLAGGVCYLKQDKSGDMEVTVNNLSNWLANFNEPSIFSLDKNEGIFSFDHIGDDTDFGVGWTRIMKNGEIKDSLGFYTNYIDPILTPLSGDTLIGSAWQWPQDSKLYNGPFFNYYLDFTTRKTVKFSTRGKLIAKSPDGEKAVFLESECVKNPAVLEIDHSCNNQNLSLRLVDLPPENDGHFISHFKETKLLDFNKVVFSPDGRRLAIEAKIESVDYDTVNEYWTLFIADAETGEIIRQNNRLYKNRSEYVFWLDEENVLYW